jgi:hypothetical protein
MAPNNGGVWKTTDYGRTWNPIFDNQPDDPQHSGSIGALAIAPSNPDIIYVGSGEGLRRPDLSTGDGIYKSTDGGANVAPSGSTRWRPSRCPADRQHHRRSQRSQSPLRSRARDIPTVQTPSAESTARSTAAKPSKEFSIKTKTSAEWISSSIPATRRSSSPACGPRAVPCGQPAAATTALAAASTNRPMAADHWQQLTKGLPGEAEGIGRIGPCHLSQRSRSHVRLGQLE